MLSIFRLSTTQMRHIQGDVSHVKDNFLPEDSLEYMRRLQNDIPWDHMRWGRGHLPRLTFRLDPDEDGITRYPEVLQELKDRTEETFKCTVRSVWCNYYRSGGDYTPPHQDNYGAHVITWSFGGTRRFICEEIETGIKTEYLLEDGDVFYFSPDFDRRHKHSIPKTTKAVDPRISIVFFTDQPYCGSHYNIHKQQFPGNGLINTGVLPEPKFQNLFGTPLDLSLLDRTNVLDLSLLDQDGNPGEQIQLFVTEDEYGNLQLRDLTGNIIHIGW